MFTDIYSNQRRNVMKLLTVYVTERVCEKPGRIGEQVWDNINSLVGDQVVDKVGRLFVQVQHVCINVQ
jgi:hypothetical protein